MNDPGGGWWASNAQAQSEKVLRDESRTQLGNVLQNNGLALFFGIGEGLLGQMTATKNRRNIGKNVSIRCNFKRLAPMFKALNTRWGVGRKEYWMFQLFSFIIAILLGVIGAIIHTSILSNIYALAVLLPGIAAAIRRMHDTDRSGWWILVPFANLVFLCLDSQPGTNRFGPNPKGVA